VVRSDTARLADIDALGALVKEKFGQIDFVFINAGISELGPFDTELFPPILAGRSAYLTDGVQRALGRQPRDFADYARETAATGVWGGVRHA
jgi:NAD(P)-dependent dehydrogenase (short-subunit alcohol dehydrogenase family)